MYVYIFSRFPVAFAILHCRAKSHNPPICRASRKVIAVSAAALSHVTYVRRVLIPLKGKTARDATRRTKQQRVQRDGHFFAACQSKEGFKRERAEIFPAHATVYHFGSAAYINPVI